MTEYLELEHLRVDFRTYSGVNSVLDIDELHVPRGHALGLVGESGAGKSVLALTILSLLRRPPAIVHGRILLEGDDLLAKSQDEMRRIRGSRIAMIFQDPMSTLNPVFTVGDQILRVIRQNRSVSKSQARQLASEMVQRVELPDPDNLLKKYPHQLSGGQRQRIIIAMALSCGAELLIADEPTRNLDVTIQAGILKLLAGLRREMNMTLLFIANNLGLVSALCDQVGILLAGRIVEFGSVREVVHEAVHPYTQTLLQAVPKQRRDRPTIAGPSAAAVIAEIEGCGYAARCERKTEDCQTGRPLLRHLKGTHYVACDSLSKGGEVYGRRSDERSALARA